MLRNPLQHSLRDCGSEGRERSEDEKIEDILLLVSYSVTTLELLTLS